MPILLIVWLAKLAAVATRLRGGSGSALPGYLAERLRPDILKRLAMGLSQGSLIITGTNGKTTTTKLLAAILESNGQAVVVNRSGSNLSRGVISALIANLDWRGRPRRLVGLFEVDEAWVPKVVAALRPRAIVILNLFRDQLDRYGELDRTAKVMSGAIKASQSQVILNADDPLVASLAAGLPHGRVVTFGIDALTIGRLGEDRTADSESCPVCGRALHYRRRYFSHLGIYACPEGHFQRPRATVTAKGVELKAEAGSDLKIMTPAGDLSLTLPLPGLYNVYNALAATAAAQAMAVVPAVIEQVLATAKAAFGRVEAIEYRGRHLLILLIKNPAGFTQILQTFLLGRSGAKVVLAINDNLADGRDVSWLWDVPLEELSASQPVVITSGTRGVNMQLRLKYAGIEAEQTDDPLSALNRWIDRAGPGETIYVLPTYTAMLALRQRLAKTVKLPEMNA